jgi:hypothetical protein
MVAIVTWYLSAAAYVARKGSWYTPLYEKIKRKMGKINSIQNDLANK